MNTVTLFLIFCVKNELSSNLEKKEEGANINLDYLNNSGESSNGSQEVKEGNLCDLGKFC